MFRLFTSCIFLLSYSYLIAQSPVIQIDNRSMSFPILSQQEIDRLQPPAEGFVVMNKTSGCLNYYLNNSWFQLCGNCLPETSPYYIDSIVQKNAMVEIYFRKSDADTLHIVSDKQKITVSNEESPALLRLPLNVDSLFFNASVSNKCYSNERLRSYSIAIRRISFSVPKTVSIENKNTIIRNISETWWMCEDWLKAPANASTDQRLISYSDNMCPAGWKIPNRKAWQDLLNVFEGNVSEIFEPAETENASIQLRLLGAYSNDEKKMYSEGSTGNYWVGETDSKGKQYLINITRNGYMFVSENKERARLNLRCVKYE